MPLIYVVIVNNVKFIKSSYQSEKIITEKIKIHYPNELYKIYDVSTTAKTMKDIYTLMVQKYPRDTIYSTPSMIRIQSIAYESIVKIIDKQIKVLKAQDIAEQNYINESDESENSEDNDDEDFECKEQFDEYSSSSESSDSDSKDDSKDIKEVKEVSSNREYREDNIIANNLKRKTYNNREYDYDEYNFHNTDRIKLKRKTFVEKRKHESDEELLLSYEDFEHIGKKLKI